MCLETGKSLRARRMLVDDSYGWRKHHGRRGGKRWGRRRHHMVAIEERELTNESQDLEDANEATAFVYKCGTCQFVWGNRQNRPIMDEEDDEEEEELDGEFVAIQA